MEAITLAPLLHDRDSSYYPVTPSARNSLQFQNTQKENSPIEFQPHSLHSSLRYSWLSSAKPSPDQASIHRHSHASSKPPSETETQVVEKRGKRASSSRLLLTRFPRAQCLSSYQSGPTDASSNDAAHGLKGEDYSTLRPSRPDFNKRNSTPLIGSETAKSRDLTLKQNISGISCRSFSCLSSYSSSLSLSTDDKIPADSVHLSTYDPSSLEITGSSASSLLSLYLCDSSIDSVENVSNLHIVNMTPDSQHLAIDLNLPSDCNIIQGKSSPVFSIASHGSSENLETNSHTFSPVMGSYSSPASSMIFERSVQDARVEDHGIKIPLHLSSDDFIPPVLNASCEALNNHLIDPETVETLSLRRPSSVRCASFCDHPPFLPTCSAPISYTVTSKDSTDITKYDSQNDVFTTKYIPHMASHNRSTSNSSLPLHMPTSSGQLDSKKIRLRESYSNLRSKNDNSKVLSFCSFADLVSAECSTQGPLPIPESLSFDSPISQTKLSHPMLSREASPTGLTASKGSIESH